MKMELFRKQQDFNHHSKYVMITLWCKHLILRIDYACNFKMESPKGSVEYPYTIATRAKWSKNIVSFANCPDQIMFGSKRWQDCVHQRAGKCTWFRPALYVCMPVFYYYTFCINAGLSDFWHSLM
jgi:hypothetical protein